MTFLDTAARRSTRPNIPPKPPVSPVKLDAWKTATGEGQRSARRRQRPARRPDTKANGAKTDAELLAIADPAPPECTDAIVDPALAKHGAATDENGQRLIAYSLAGRLARTSANAPALKGTGDKRRW